MSSEWKPPFPEAQSETVPPSEGVQNSRIFNAGYDQGVRDSSARIAAMEAAYGRAEYERGRRDESNRAWNGDEHGWCRHHRERLVERIAALEKERDELLFDGRNLVAANFDLGNKLQAAREALENVSRFAGYLPGELRDVVLAALSDPKEEKP